MNDSELCLSKCVVQSQCVFKSNALYSQIVCVQQKPPNERENDRVEDEPQMSQKKERKKLKKKIGKKIKYKKTQFLLKIIIAEAGRFQSWFLISFADLHIDDDDGEQQQQQQQRQQST